MCADERSRMPGLGERLRQLLDFPVGDDPPVRRSRPAPPTMASAFSQSASLPSTAVYFVSSSTRLPMRSDCSGGGGLVPPNDKT